MNMSSDFRKGAFRHVFRQKLNLGLNLKYFCLIFTIHQMFFLQFKGFIVILKISFVHFDSQNHKKKHDSYKQAEVLTM